MDLVYIVTTDVCCYRYDPALRARTQIIEDRRICCTRWTPRERKAYYAAEDKYNLHHVNTICDYWKSVFIENRAREPDKTLIEMPVNRFTMTILWNLMRNVYNREHNDRALVFSFFHSDDETAGFSDGSPPELLLQNKGSWLEMFMKDYAFVRTVEIPYDFTLTEEYMRGLFEEHIGSATEPWWLSK
jgi:hypothetical protein